jgi:parvulin-like peptidyl-prolyl isomerase
MKRILLVAAVAVSSWASPEHASAREDGSTEADAALVARVNGDPVTQAELRRMRANPRTRRELQQELGVEDPDPRELDRLALRKLVQQRLLVQEASRRNITVTVEELDHAIAALRRRFDDLEGFGAWMREQGLADKSLFETVRADLTADRVWASLVEGVRITEEQARQYYDAHRQELVAGEEVRLRIIAVEDAAAAEEILAALRKGASFGRLARQRSRGLRAARGGDTGWIDSRNLPEPLHEAVPLLQPGDVAGPLETGPGVFLVVGLQEGRPIRAKSLDEARPEIERRLLPSKQQEAVHAWLTRQEAKSKIEVFKEPPPGHAMRRD